METPIPEIPKETLEKLFASSDTKKDPQEVAAILEKVAEVVAPDTLVAFVPPQEASLPVPEDIKKEPIEIKHNPPEEIAVSPQEIKPTPMGRPSDFTQELADRVCEKIAEGYSMRTVCTAEGMPVMSTIFRWLREKPDFQQQYAKATEERTEAMSEDILDIADDGTNDFMSVKRGKEWVEVENKEVTNRSRLRVDTRKWLMSKMKPKKYADKMDITSDGKAIKGNSIIFSNFKE